MTSICCVLRSGGDYGPEHVARLHAQVARHAPGVEFLCLTDMPEVLGIPGCRVGGLMHFWPGWWSKFEALARPGPMLYLDLDVSVVGDLAPLLELAEHHDLIMSRGFWGPADPNPWNSSVMGWKGDAPRVLYEIFCTDPATYMTIGKQRDCWGDQGIIARYYPYENIVGWQDLARGAVMSYKRGALLGHDMSKCAVLASHGKPRPWEDGGADQWLAKRSKAA